MAAIVSGSSLGLLNSSLYVLGSQGALGQANQGRAGEQVFVNGSTGNLVIQNRDELVIGRGPDLSLLRTYNSQGLFDGDNNDNWRFGVYRKVTNLTGTVNTAGSTVTRVAEDGSESVYTFDATLGKYVCHDGGGSFDTLSFASATQTWTWSWTDGTNQLTELYDNANGGRITKVQDQDGNSLTFIYNAAGLITQVSDADGETTFLDYTGTDLTQLRTVTADSPPKTIIRTRYAYDASHRLTTVTTDLTPENTADSSTYVVNYTYDGTSKRVASLTQSDGNNLTFTYEQVGTVFRLKTYTDAANKTTTLQYSPGSGTTVSTTATANNAVLSTTETTTTTSTVQPYYAVQDGNTWTSITQAVYGTSNANAVAAFQAALPTPLPTLTTGTRITVPPTITYTGPSTTANANAAALATSGWVGESLLETSATTASLPSIGMDGAGNAMAVWLQGTDLLASRYDKASGTWSAATVLDNRTNAITTPQLYVDASGNAIATWVQSDGTANSTYVNRFVNGTWQGTQLIETATVAVAEPKAAINAAGDAVVVWRQTSGTVQDLYANRYSGGAWTGALLIESLTTTVATPGVAIDTQGNIVAIWQQSDGTANSIYSNRYTVGTGWSGASLRESSATAASLPAIGMDSAGNAIALWLQGTDLLASRFDKASGTWSANATLDNRTNAITAPKLYVDASGNAIATWVQSDGTANSTYANRFVNGAWQGTELIETATDAVAEPAASINASGQAAVVWRQTSGSVQDLWANRYSGSAWSGAQQIETGTNSVVTPGVAIDAQGNIQAVWQQSDGIPSIYTNRYLASTAPFYTVQAGNTWSSIAQAVYGDVAAAGPLQAALANPALTAGTMLTVPPSLSFTPATAASNSAALSTTDTQTTNFSLNNAALTNPAAEWTAPTAIESAGGAASGLLMNASNDGDAVSVWMQGGSLFASFYESVSQLWSAPVLVSGSFTNISGVQLDVDFQACNAIVTWIDATTNKVYANRGLSNGASVTWGGAQLVATTTATLNEASGTINLNGTSAVVWRATSGTTQSVMASRWTGTAWGVAEQVTSGTVAITAPQVAATQYDVIEVAWRASDGTAESLFVRGFNAGAWSATHAVESSSVPVGMFRIDTDIYGDLNISFVQGNDVSVVCGDEIDGWGSPAVFLGTSPTPISQYAYSDSAGNNLVAWITTDGKVYARRWNDGAVELLGTGTGLTDIAADINGPGQAVVSWRAGNDLIVTQFDGSTWNTPAPLESSSLAASTPKVAVDESGKQFAVWIQNDGTADTVFFSRYATGGTGSPYYTIRTGDTWSSIAVALYGNSSVAGALQSALANPPLTAGNQLTGFPATLSGTTTVTVPAYYLVPSGPTWASITQAVYGTSDANAQLALRDALGLGTAVPSAGTHLAVPASIRYSGPAGSTTSSANSAALSTTITTTTTVTVAPYYAVQPGDSWSNIAQTVYGDSQAGSALQTALAGGATPTAGAHLGVPQSLTYNKTVSGGTRVDITDPLGLVSTMISDAQGQITQVLAPAMGGVRQSASYTYNANGDVTQVTDARGLVTTYSYDANGNRTLERDAAGNTITRVFGSKNELQTETSYLVPDPDGAGAGQAGSPLTTRYVYDAGAHLRFELSGEGRVSEYRYNASGQRIAAIQYTGSLYNLTGLTTLQTPTEAQLVSFVTAADKTKTERIDFTYDFRGQLQTTTSYGKVDAAGVGVNDTDKAVTNYIYDQAGNLLNTVDGRGSSTAYVYDGLGRLKQSTDATGRITTTFYDDTNKKTVLTSANGLVTTSTYDAKGELISVVQSVGAQGLGTTSYFYDADGRLRRTVDPTGTNTHILYDDAGRKIATIDGTGTLTEYRYDADNNLARTIQYATAVSAANLALLADTQGNPTTTTLAAIRPAVTAQDRSRWNAYDSANQLIKSVDELGFVTQNFYDGAGRLTDTLELATAIATAALGDAPSASSINPAASPSDRLTRNFYDADGKLRGTLDAEGYLVEYKYDAAGELIETVGYAQATSPVLRPSGTLSQLIPAAADANDIHSYTLYNAKGQVVGVVDGEGYLTETVYDLAGNKTQVIGYATKVTYAAGATIVSLRPAANAQDQASSYAYTALNQLSSETNFEGTQASYAYDSVGNLTQTVKALNTADVRTLTAQYDKQGRLTAQLTGNGSAQLTGNLTQAQIDAIWAANAVKYTYDSAGRRVSATDPNGNKTLYFYDADGQLNYAINALGEVSQAVYNALGQKTKTVQYGTRLSSATLATLGGGLVNATLTGAIAAIANSGLDSATNYAYTNRGQVASTSDALGFATSATYNAFGDAIASSQQLGSGQTLDHSYFYDRRGLLTLTAWDPLGINTTESTQYDAFGRAVQGTDARGNVRTKSYDRLGRVVTTTVDPGAGHLAIGTSATYDAFDRVLTQTDALGNTTSYAYNTANRSVTVTTPEGITVTTAKNRLGDTVSVTDGRGNSTVYQYDKDGNLIQSQSPGLSPTVKSYDAADLLKSVTDANGTVTAYAYDAAARVLTRTVDPGAGHLNLVSSYGYDAKGQLITMTDAKGGVTQTQFDLKGQVTSVTVDPGTGHLNLSTTYTYDGRSKKLTVTEGAGSASPKVTQYTYDKLGRLTKQQVDPSGVNATTSYVYDNNDNVAKKTDADGNVTRYVYDADDRLVYTVDALGGLTKNDYDAEGNLIRTTEYATPLTGAALAALPDVATLANIASPAGAAQATGHVYDKDGREKYLVDALGNVTQKDYDGNGNVIRTVAYALAIPGSTPLVKAPVDGALLAQQGADANRVTRTVYDAANRAVYAIDAMNYVTEIQYDGVGQVLKTIHYSQQVSVGAAPTPADMAFAVADRYALTISNQTDTLYTNPSQPNPYSPSAQQDTASSVTQSVSIVRGSVTNPTPPVQPYAYVSAAKNDIASTMTQSVAVTNASQTNTTPPSQPYTYVGSAKNDVGTPASAPATLTVQNTAVTQTPYVVNNSWVRSGTTLVPTGGVSLTLPGIPYDSTPSMVRATIYKSDGSFYAQTYTDVGYENLEYWYTDGSAEYGYSNYYGLSWVGVGNWGGKVNLSSGAMPAGQYTVVIEARDDYEVYTGGGYWGYYGYYYSSDADSTSSYGTTLSITIAPAQQPTFVRWPASVQPQGTASISFSYRPAGSGGAFTSVGIADSGTSKQVTIQSIAPGSYEYNISYLDSFGQAIESATGVFSTANGQTTTVNASFNYTQVTSTASTGSSISGYIAAAQVSSIHHISTSVTDAITGAVVSTGVLTYPENEAGYNGNVNLKLGTPLANGRYRVSITVFYKNGTIEAKPVFTYEVGSQGVFIVQTLSWAASTALPNTTPAFLYRTAGSTGAYTSAAVTVSGANHQVVLNPIAAGNYEYQIQYKDSFNRSVKSASGTFSVTGGGSTTLNPTFSYTQVSSTVSSGSSIRGYVAAADVPTIDHLSATVTNAATGAVVTSGVLTYPESEASYNGEVNLRLGSELANGRYNVAITVFKKDGTVVNKPVFLYEVGSQSTYTVDTLIWPADTAPAGSTPSFGYRQAGSTGAFTSAAVTVSGANHQVVLNPIAAGNYEYQIQYKDATYSNRILKSASGSFTVSASGTTTLGATFSSTQVSSAIAAGSSITGYITAAEVPTIDYVEAFVRDLSGNLVSSALTYPESEPAYNGRVNLKVGSALPAGGSYNITIVVHKKDGTTQTRPVLAYQVPGTTTGTGLQAIQQRTTTVSWQTPLGVNAATAQFSYAPVGSSSFTSVPVSQNGANQQAALSNLADGSYTYLVKYFNGSQLVKQASGTFTAAPSGSASGQVRFVADLAVDPDTLTTSQAFVSDAAGRQTFAIDERGFVTQRTYDANGNVVQEVRYANPLQGTFVSGVAPLIVTAAPTSGSASYVIVDPARDAVTRTVYDAANQATFVIDAMGYVTQRIYDNNGNVTKETRYYNPFQGTFVAGVAPQIVTDSRDQTTRQFYDAAGRMRYGVNAEGYVTERRLDAMGNETARIRYASPYPVTASTNMADMTRDFPNVALNALPATAVVEQASYDATGRVVDVTDGAGTVTRNLYDALGNKTDVIKALGTAAASTTHYVYDADGREVEETAAYGSSIAATTRYVLDAFGNRTGIIDPRGVELAEQNTAWAQAERQRLGYPMLTSGLLAPERATLLGKYTTTQAFDKVGNITSTTDGLGNSTRTVYDARGNAVKIIDPRGNSGYFYFDAGDNVRFHIDPMGYATEYRYDPFGNVKDELHYDKKVSGTYDEKTALNDIAQRVAAQAGALDRQTSKAYDRVGQVSTVTYQGTGVSYTETYQYDAFGNKRQYKNKNDAVYDYEYDRVGNLKKEIAPAADVVTPTTTLTNTRLTTVYDYDALGNRTRMTEAFGLTGAQRLTVYGYDKLGHQTHVEAPAFFVYDRASNTSVSRTPTTDRTYDAAGNLVMEVEPDTGRVLNYYDALNRKVASVNADNALSEYEYDSAGNLIRERAYDIRMTGALTWQTRPAAPSTDGYREMRYSYNANNLRTRTETRVETLFSFLRLQSNLDPYYDTSVVTTTEYNANGDIVRSVDGNGNSTYQFYDAVGNRTLQITAYQSYDAVAKRMTDPVGYVTRWEYNAEGQVVRESRYANPLPAAMMTTLTTAANPQGLIAAVADAPHLDVKAGPADAPAWSEWRARQSVPFSVGTLFRGEVTTDASSSGAGRRLGLGLDNAGAGSAYRRETAYFVDNTLYVSYFDGTNWQSPVISAAGAIKNNATYVVEISVEAGGARLYVYEKGLTRAQGWSHLMALTDWGQVYAYGFTYAEPNWPGTRDSIDNLSIASPAGTTLWSENFNSGTDSLKLTNSVPGAEAYSTPNRVTDYIYDRLGRVATERKKAVTFSTLDASHKPVDQTADLDTSYAYDGEGHVKAVTLPNAQGRTDYSYDALGRRTQELDPQFQAFNGYNQPLVTTRGETDWTYDAFGNVAAQTQVALTAAENRQTLSNYDNAGRLRTQIGPEGLTTTYDYDIAGNVVRKSNTVTDVGGVSHTYRTYYTYDHLNRELSHQDTEDGDTLPPVIRDTRYNAFGDIEAKGTNGLYQEQYKYDKLGHLFFTNKENGTPRLYAYDANGNAVLEEHAINTDLSTVAGPNGPIPVTGPVQMRLFSPLDVQMTMSLYDARNQITDVFQPPMEFANLLAAPVITNNGAPGAPTEALSDLTQYRQVDPMSLVSTQGGALGSGSTVPLSATQTVTSGYGAASGPTTTSTAVAVTLADVGLSATPVVSPTTSVLEASSDTTSLDGLTRTVTERVRETTVSTQGTVQGLTVLKTVTTTTDIINRTTIFTRNAPTQTFDTGAGGDSAANLWKTDRTENLNVNRSVKTEQWVYSRSRDVVTTATNNITSDPAAWKDSAAAFSPAQTIRVTSTPQYGYWEVSDESGTYQVYGWTGNLIIDVYVPIMNFFGTGPISISETWENGNARVSHDAVFSNDPSDPRPGHAQFVIRYDGNGVAVVKGMGPNSPGILVASLGMDRSWTANSAWVMGGNSAISIRPQNSAAATVQFSSKLGTQTLALASAAQYPGLDEQGFKEFLLFSSLAANDWYSYKILDSLGRVLNDVQGTVGGAQQNKTIVTTTTTLTQTVNPVASGSGTSNYNYATTVGSQQQSNYFRNLAEQISQGVANSNVIHRQQTYDAFGEVIREIDGRGNQVDSTYNDLGKLTLKQDPTTDVSMETGAPVRARPTTHYYYDELGQLVGTQDAVSDLSATKYYNTRVLVAGRVEQEFDAAGYTKTYRYDRLGNQRLVTNENGLDTESRYDRAGHLTRIIRYDSNKAQYAFDAFDYDKLGNRIGHTNALVDASGVPLRETYLYDGQGRILRHTSFAGVQTNYKYEYDLTIGGVSGYKKTTTTKGVGVDDQEIDKTDYFGKIRYHKDMGGHEFTYLYNYAGWLKQQDGTTSAAADATTLAPARNAQHITYDYYQNGYLKTVSDTGINSYSTYQYDKNGNRIYEAVFQAPIGSAPTTNPFQTAVAEYDELNRVKRVYDQAKFDVHYAYDANGNRRSIESTYYDLLTSSPNQVQNFYYLYDRMNRFTTTMGQRDATGKIVRGSTGYDIGYNGLGQRTLVLSDHLDNNGVAVPTQEIYTYYPDSTVKDAYITTYTTPQRTTGTTRHTLRQNDALGRVNNYFEYDVGGVNWTRWVHYEYDYDNRANLEETHDVLKSGYQSTKYNYVGDGILVSSETKTLTGPDQQAANTAIVTLNYDYQKWDSYKDYTVTIHGAAANTYGWQDGQSTYAYDSNGHVARVFDSQAHRTLVYANNHEGMVLSRDQIQANTSPVIRHFFALNGVVIGDVGTDKVPSRVDYGQALADYDQRTLQEYISRNGATRHVDDGTEAGYDVSISDEVTGQRAIQQRVFPVTSADFDQNYQPISDSYPAHAAGSFVTRDGDTLQSIALALWGDSSLWYLLADANGLTGTAQIPGGMRLTIPNVVTNIHNNSGTFRPYDAGLALGDTTPTLPDPPPPPRPDSGCGTIGMIVVMVVVIVVAFYTQQYYLLDEAATMMAAASEAGDAILTAQAVVESGAMVGTSAATEAAVAGAVAGNLAGQAVGNLIGTQKGFSMESFMSSVLTAGIGSAIGPIGSGTWGQVATAAVNNAVGQGVNVMMGQQKKFDWRSVAASAVAAPVVDSVGKGVSKLTGGNAFATAFVKGTISQGINVAAHRGRDINYGQIAGSVFGGAIGASLAADLTRPEAQRPAYPTVGSGAQDTPLGGGLRATPAMLANWGPKFSFDSTSTEYTPSRDPQADPNQEVAAMAADPVPPSPGSWITVQKGDALERLAGDKETFGAMILANGIKDPNLILADRELFRPNPGEYDREEALKAANDFYRSNAASQQSVLAGAPVDVGSAGGPFLVGNRVPLTPENLYTPAGSFIGDAFRGAWGEARNPSNTLLDRIVYGGITAATAVPGFLNDLGAAIYNSPNDVYVGAQRMTIAVDSGDTYGFSRGLMQSSAGVLNIATLGLAGEAVVASEVAMARLQAANAEARVTYEVADSTIHKNSLEYVGDTHVYRIIGPDGTTYKIGESAQGVRVSDGASIRAEQQVRELQRETGDIYKSEILRDFPDKASARQYETQVIERFRRIYGDNALPGNKTNR